MHMSAAPAKATVGAEHAAGTRLFKRPMPVGLTEASVGTLFALRHALSAEDARRRR